MKKTILLLMALIAGAAAWAENYITDVMVIGGSKSETTNLKNKYTGQGWTFIDKDLNDGCGSGSDYVYLLYKSASETTTGATFITHFLVSTVTGTIPDSFQSSDRTYYLVPFDGSDYFKNNKGDLNSHCGSSSATIHLYYTKDYDRDGRDYATVKSITFNDTQDGGVTADGGSTGYDLNTGCGSSSDYIYMHAGKAPGWLFWQGSPNECVINGFEGPTPLFTSITIPTVIDKATVLGITNQVFSGFDNLESMTFGRNTSITQMPSVQGCSKFKHVNIIMGVSGDNLDITPPSMTRIPSSTFVGTAINRITMDSVTFVGSDAFKGCDSLTSVTFKKSPVLIEYGAFSEISKACQVSYPGSMDDWNPMMYMYSKDLVIHNGNSWYCGWCGSFPDNDDGTIRNPNNHLYWTLQNNHLKINCATDNWDYYPDQQVITSSKWDKSQVKYLTLEHVYDLREYEFEDCNKLKSVDVKSGLKSIGERAFANCDSLQKIYLPSCLEAIGSCVFAYDNELSDLYFDGSKTQWDLVSKAETWDYFILNNLKVHWHCTVTFDANGHGTAPDPVFIQWSNEDTLDEPTAPTATGYTFKGWYKEPECINKWDFTWTVPGDMRLYAKWEANLQRGDINGDNKVDVSDVNIIINIMLGKSQASSYPGNPDLNNDNKVDVSDVNAVINIMLGK